MKYTTFVGNLIDYSVCYAVLTIFQPKNVEMKIKSTCHIGISLLIFNHFFFLLEKLKRNRLTDRSFLILVHEVSPVPLPDGLFVFPVGGLFLLHLPHNVLPVNECLKAAYRRHIIQREDVLSFQRLVTVVGILLENHDL